MKYSKYLKAFERVKDERDGFSLSNNYFPGYRMVCRKRGYTLYKPSLTKKRIVAAWNSVVCALSNLNKKAIYIYPNYKNTHNRYCVYLNEKNFPGLLPNSQIANCLIIPYIRNISESVFLPSWRVVVITDKCQVFHNYPSRNGLFDGESHHRDIIRFVESEIWDLPGNKYPSSKKEHDNVEYYNPFLPEECYEYHPKIDNKSTDDYGGIAPQKSKTISINGESIKLARFYFPLRRIEANSFSFMGGFSPDYKMTLLGTYQSNSQYGVRTVVFATSNGGKDFYAKYEFDDSGLRKSNYGNPLNGCIFSEYSCDSEELIMQKRILNDSSSKIPYSYENGYHIVRIINSCPIVIETAEECNLSDGTIVKLSGDVIDTEWKDLFNSNHYKVKRVSEKQFALYELVSKSNTGIACRHIHGINRVKDGWLICTGETYPEGWLFYVQMKATDTWERVDAGTPLDFIRLNYSQNSVQRIIGSILYDDDDSTLLIASDSSILDRKSFYDGLSHSSTGIFKGSISNIDDFATFKIAHEMKEVCYCFKEINGVLFACGQRGEIAFSFDKGNTWESNRIDMALQHFTGSTPEFSVIDGWLIASN